MLAVSSIGGPCDLVRQKPCSDAAPDVMLLVLAPSARATVAPGSVS